jgi:hypothetical protein
MEHTIFEIGLKFIGCCNGFAFCVGVFDSLDVFLKEDLILVAGGLKRG